MDGLIKKGDPAALADVIDQVTRQDERRVKMQQRILEYHEGRNPVNMPRDVTNPVLMRTRLAQTQHDMLMGVLDNMPKLRVGTASDVQDDKDRAQARENAANALFPALQNRSGAPIWPRTILDAIMYGFGVDSVRGIAHRYSHDNGFPKLDSFSKDLEGSRKYESARTRRRHVMAVNGREGLPVEWQWVPAMGFYWRESQESPNGLSFTVESQTRNVKDLVESDRYRTNLPDLWKIYEKVAEANPGGAAMARCRFIIVEDKFLVSYLVLPEPVDNQGRAASDMALSAQHDFWNLYGGSSAAGELADQFTNPVGYPQYVVTRGMFSNSQDPSLQYRGFCQGILDLIGSLDAVLSWRTTRVRREAFPAWFVKTETVAGPGGVPLNAGLTLQDMEPPPLVFHPGADLATRGRPGESIEPILNTGGGPYEEWDYREIQRLAEGQVIPSTLLDARGLESGYMMNSLSETIMSRIEPLIEGVKIGHIQRWYLVCDQISAMKEPFEFLGSVDKRTHAASIWKLDPEKFDELEAVEALYGLKKRANTPIDIQNAGALLQTRLMTAEDIAADILGVEDYPRVQKWWMIEDWKQTPQVREWMTNKLLELTGILVGDAVAKRQGRFSLQQFMNSNTNLAARIRARTGLGQPGYGTAQRAPVDPSGVYLEGMQSDSGAAAPPNPNRATGVPSPIQTPQRMLGSGGQSGRPAGASNGLQPTQPRPRGLSG